ncbi:hypothetical protein D9M71_678360 [compost metagenome]
MGTHFTTCLNLSNPFKLSIFNAVSSVFTLAFFKLSISSRAPTMPSLQYIFRSFGSAPSATSEGGDAESFRTLKTPPVIATIAGPDLSVISAETLFSVELS